MKHDLSDRSPLRFMPTERHALTVHPQDAAILDELFGDEPAAEADAARRARVTGWLAVAGRAQAAQPPGDLLARTLTAVAQERQRPRAPAGAEAWRSRGFSFGRQLGQWATLAVAASLLMAVMVPGLGAARQHAKQVACSANLGAMGGAFATYAANSNGALPTLGASPDGNWLPHEVRLGPGGHSNTANLLPLVRAGYASRERLVCPARSPMPARFDPQANEIPDNIRGYSYVNLFGPAPRWDQQTTTIILADRNPLFADGPVENPFLNSPNHGRRGTNVLNAAQEVQWVTTPNVGPDGDNIWTIGQTPRCSYTGRETVQHVRDLFLSP